MDGWMMGDVKALSAHSSSQVIPHFSLHAFSKNPPTTNIAGHRDLMTILLSFLLIGFHLSLLFASKNNKAGNV